MENIKYEKKYLKYKNKYKNKRNYLLEKKSKKLTGGSLNGMTIIAIILALISIIGIGTGIGMKKDKIYNYINKNSDLFEKTINNIKTKEQIEKTIEDQKIAQKNAEEEQLEKEAKEHRRSKVKKVQEKIAALEEQLRKPQTPEQKAETKKKLEENQGLLATINEGFNSIAKGFSGLWSSGEDAIDETTKEKIEDAIDETTKEKIEEGKKTGKQLWSIFREKAIPFSKQIQKLKEKISRRHNFLLEPVYNLESPEQLPPYNPGDPLSDEIAKKQGNPIEELRYLFDNLEENTKVNKNTKFNKYLASRIKNMEKKDNELHWDILLAHFYWKDSNEKEVIINTYPRFGDPNDIISFKYVNKNWFQLENVIIFEGENYIINITNMKNDYNRIKKKINEMSETLSNLDLVENIFKKVDEILTNTDKHGELCYSDELKNKDTANFTRGGAVPGARPSGAAPPLLVSASRQKNDYEEKLIEYNKTYMELSRLDKLINIPDLHNLSEFNKDLNKYYAIQKKVGKKENLDTEKREYMLFIEEMNRYLIEQEKKEKAKSSWF